MFDFFSSSHVEGKKLAILVSNNYCLISIVLTNVTNKSEAIIPQKTNYCIREWERHFLGILIISIYIMHLKTLKTYVVLENPFSKLK